LKARFLTLEESRFKSYSDVTLTLTLNHSLSRPIVGSDESCDGAVKLVDSREFLYVFNKLDSLIEWLYLCDVIDGATHSEWDGVESSGGST
jgi:hypothetical protein